MSRLTYDEAYDIFYSDEYENIIGKFFNIKSVDRAFDIIENFMDELTTVLDKTKFAGPLVDGFTYFMGDLYSYDVGKRVITSNGQEYYIVDVDEGDKSMVWVSSNPSDVHTGKGRNIFTDDIAYISEYVEIEP